jgi:hypothetical protein
MDGLREQPYPISNLKKTLVQGAFPGICRFGGG